MLILPLLLAAAAAVQAPATRCPDVVTTDAMVCRALEAKAAGDHAGSAAAFEGAAAAAEASDTRIARLWAAAGNMWLAAGENGKAALAIDRALAMPGLMAEQRGEAQLDRARIALEQGDIKLARKNFDAAIPSIGEDAFAWYIGTAIAIREGDGARAMQAASKALTLEPENPTLLFEAGHAAQVAGDEPAARDYWSRASAADPNGAAGKAAREALQMIGLPLVEKPAPTR